jgi:hypothetical protein
MLSLTSSEISIPLASGYQYRNAYHEMLQGQKLNEKPFVISALLV